MKEEMKMTTEGKDDTNEKKEYHSSSNSTLDMCNS
jgi:hypothetical protein